MMVTLREMSREAADAILAGDPPHDVRVAQDYPTEFSVGVAQCVGAVGQFGPYQVHRSMVREVDDADEAGNVVSLVGRGILRRVHPDVPQIGPVGSRLVTIVSGPCAVDGGSALVVGLKASVFLGAQRSRRVARFGGPVTKFRRPVPRIRRRDELAQLLSSPFQT